MCRYFISVNNSTFETSLIFLNFHSIFSKPDWLCTIFSQKNSIHFVVFPFFTGELFDFFNGDWTSSSSSIFFLFSTLSVYRFFVRFRFSRQNTAVLNCISEFQFFRQIEAFSSNFLLFNIFNLFNLKIIENFMT